MIKLLGERGEAIKNSNQGKVFQIEHLIKLEREYQYHARVCGAFVTFESDKDLKTAKAICEQTKLQIFGKPVTMKRSEEPSNYIWENLGITKQKQRVNRTFVSIALIVVLTVAYNLQYRMQKSVAYFDKYEQIDCELYYSRFGNGTFQPSNE